MKKIFSGIIVIWGENKLLILLSISSDLLLSKGRFMLAQNHLKMIIKHEDKRDEGGRRTI